VRLLYYVNIVQPGNTQAEQSALTNLEVHGITTDAFKLLGPTRQRQILERLDVIRHKEVVTKAVTAILVILLKAFKSDRKYLLVSLPGFSLIDTL
jgi:hypothetical protein